jgi:hypothetical protein
MRFHLPLLMLGLFSAIEPAAAEPMLELRVLKTDAATAGYIQKAVDEGRVTAVEMEDRLDGLKGKGTVTEHGRFKQAFGAGGEPIEFKKDAEEIRIADGELAPVGLFLEVEPYASPLGLVDMRFDVNHSVSVRKNRIELDRTLSSATVKADAWEILAAWGDGAESTLLMAHVAGVEKEREPAFHDGNIREIICHGELILCEENDLKTFGRSTPATRAKAIDWLKKRGEALSRSSLRIRSGQKVTQQNVLQWIHDKNGWDTAELGLTVEVEGQVGPFGKLVDLRVEAAWHPRDVPRPPDGPLCEFRLADTASSGETFVVEPKTRPDAGPVPVLFVTPVVHTILEAGERPAPSSGGKAGGIGVYRHFVHPSFMRKLAELAKFNPNPVAGMVQVPRPKDLLEELGMKFPDGTRVSFRPSHCEVTLMHTAEGNALFEQILKESDLALPGE